MGCVQSSETDPDSEPRDTAGSTERRPRLNDVQRRAVKVLLLGAKGSGKSTIQKQMKLLYEGNFTSNERDSYAETIRLFVVRYMRTILEILPDLGLEISSHNQGYVSTVMRTYDIEPSVCQALRVLSQDDAVNEVLVRSNEYQLPDAVAYFLNLPTMERVISTQYIPTNDDILHVYVPTTGISRTNFPLDGKHLLSVYDFGGARSERRKWANCFGNADVLIFIAGLSEYDQKLDEHLGVVR
ncbi:hypothetical protein H0H87_004684 [Tephrocybe sp. NHM501043]|nr:hypothetical protein H0H87_004684 [Tephrocybe sp. NHM501043]